MAPQVFNMGLILIQPAFQWLDAAGPVDHINTHSQEIIKYLNLPKSITDKAPIINWHYISSDLTPVQPTSGPLQIPTCTFDNCPPLDFIIIPGADPIAPAPKGFISFIQKRVADPNLKGLLMICTAALMVAQSGILDGRQVCSAKVALKSLSAAGLLDKKVKWVGDRRWVVDGKLWSAAGITSGIDLAAEFARVYFDPTIVQWVNDAAELEPKPAYPDPFAKLLEDIHVKFRLFLVCTSGVPHMRHTGMPSNIPFKSNHQAQKPSTPSIHPKLPVDLVSWKDTEDRGSEHKVIWDQLRPLLQRHGYRLWKVTMGGQMHDDKFPKYPGYTFLTPNKEKNVARVNWKIFLADNGLSHAARRLHDSQDVVLRVVTAGGQGHTHLRIHRRLAALPGILMSNNHILPILQEIVYQDITIVVVPKLIFDLNRVLRSRCRNSLEDVLYMVLQVFEGTAYLHRNLIAHRDLFPANIIVEWMPQSLVERSCMSRPRIYIIDFETAVDFPSDSTDRKCSEFPFNMSEYGRPVAPELSNGQPYCPFRLDMWQLGIDLHSQYHTGLVEIDTLWADLTADAPEDRPTADEAMQILDAYLRKTPPSELHRPGLESDAQEPVQVITQPIVLSIPAHESLTK
ncbi:hypothetical protein CVT25_001206 [Psilocybe cyanescens]|uniref:Protein kinase domain-containing protein n=1 Tax=Psilocybe cyanescens TaxID=93625 RepID=A0A409XKC2_PSICY|nr:hypothetical protein CVT25_001206 [Psilocybe cyanescens]